MTSPHLHDIGLCPLCGDPLDAKTDIRRKGARTFVARCPNEGTFVLQPDLVAALPTLESSRVLLLRDYLRALQLVSDEPNTLGLRLAEQL